MQWEYHQLVVSFGFYENQEVGMKELMDLGKQSWELVGMLKTPRDSYCLLFKRPLKPSTIPEPPPGPLPTSAEQVEFQRKMIEAEAAKPKLDFHC